MTNCIRKLDLNIKVYTLVLISLILDIGGAFQIKNITFIILVAYLIIVFLTDHNLYIPRSFFLIEGTIFLLMPLILVFISVVFWNIGIKDAIGAISTYIVWLLYPVLINIDCKSIIDKFKAAIYICSILVIITFVSIYFFYLIGRMDLILLITQFSREYSLGLLGQRPMPGGIFLPSVFFRWTFWLLIGTLLFMKDSKYKFFVCIVAVLLTLSTGTIMFTLIGMAWIIISSKKTKVKRANLVLLIAGFTLLLVLLSSFINLNTAIEFLFSKLSIENSSTSVKMGHIQSILEIIFSDVKVFLFGMGLGSSFYSVGSNSIGVNVEVSHFNLMRQFGIIYTIVFFSYIINLFIKLKKTDSDGNIFAVGLVCLFFAAGTNPLLISPVFFLVLVIGRSYVTSHKRMVNIEKERKESNRNV